jgi:hypothetical protein
MDKIIKICKVHGSLTIDQVNKTVKRGKPYYPCKLCSDISRQKTLIKNFGKCINHGKLEHYLIRKDGKCKICHRETANKKRNENREWFNEKMSNEREKNPNKWAKYYKDQYLKKKLKYGENLSLKQCCDARGITIDQYNTMYSDQNGTCAICHNPETRKGHKTNIPMRLTIDHCHKTNKVRGLLCHNCNTGIGKLCDDPVRMIRAAKYVKEGGFNGRKQI